MSASSPAAPTPPPCARRCVLTGCAGFIGSHVAEALLRQGVSVVGVDNLDDFYDPALKQHNLDAIATAAARTGSDFAFHRLDIRDATALTNLTQQVQPDLVVHLAARAGVRPSIADPALYASVNVLGTTNVLEAVRALHAPCRTLIASSSSVYGDASRVPFREDDPCVRPVSPYAATKRACELIASTYHHLHDLPIACLRFFTVFGPRQRPDLAIAKFMRLAQQGKPIPMFGDGATSRDYTYIDDIVQGVLAAARAIESHGFRIWNLGGSHPVTLREMIDAIARVTGRELRVQQLPMQPGDVQRTYADLTRSGAELGFSPHTPFEAGLRKQWAWLTAQGKTAARNASAHA
ncbi:MAG: NAD-dependent epimerase/dehydratase family protein [Planctomycetota bacterium]|nr:MAG: NAD-dependent epimerase/dehydratase family protein [Planctomycetota bacterium]